MAEYWVTFRIASDATYQKRYDAFVKAAVDATGANACWADSTSFWLLQTGLDIVAFGKKLAAALNEKTDLLVIRELAVNDSIYFGSVPNLAVLKGFLPAVKKLV